MSLLRRSLVLATIPLVAASLVLTGCAKEDYSVEETSGDISGHNDINPVPRDQVRDGGNLRRYIGVWPSNWNVLNNDGNYAEVGRLMMAVMPQAYRINAAGETSVNTDFFTDVKLTNTNPQQVTYTINPKAVWSDGRPIDWEDLKYQADALSGRNTAFKIAASQGFERVERVTQGASNRQAVLTFKQPFGDWQSQFAGNMMLLPKQVTRDVQSFNDSLAAGPGVTAGPFIVASIDRSAKRIVLARNPKWWGDPAKLDTITYTFLKDAAVVPALLNDEIDLAPLGTIDDLKNVRRTRNLAVRRAAVNQWSHITFNGAEGAILSDKKLRLAIAKGINRQGVATAILNGLTKKRETLNNHIFVRGQKGYEDNALPFDARGAAHDLDELGWRLRNGFRHKDGKRLELRYLVIEGEIGVRSAQIIQQQLQQIGVKLKIEVKPYSGFFENVIQKGQFDIGSWGWVADAFAIGTLPQIYAYNPDDLQGNYGRIGTKEINADLDALLSELDPVKSLKMANDVDKKIWDEGFSLPLWQAPGNVGIRNNLVNIGASGMASLDYTIVGFRK